MTKAEEVNRIHLALLRRRAEISSIWLNDLARRIHADARRGRVDADPSEELD